MFIKTSTETQLDAEIKSALEKLDALEKTDDAYGKLVENISKLHKLKIEETNATVNQAVKAQEMETSDFRFKPPSMDTVLVVAANVFGILWLARFEKTDVIKAPKAFGMMMKPR